MTTTTNSHAGTVTARYEAFGRGDVAGILSRPVVTATPRQPAKCVVS